MNKKKNNHSSLGRLVQNNGNREDSKYSLRKRKKKETTSSKQLAISSMKIKRHYSISDSEMHTTKNYVKSKAPPLSKYRRKTANARERTRMKEINIAFEKLRTAVPHFISDIEPTVANEKFTKITTLRLAMSYIRSLKECLSNNTLNSDNNNNDEVNSENNYTANYRGKMDYQLKHYNNINDSNLKYNKKINSKKVTKYKLKKKKTINNREDFTDININNDYLSDNLSISLNSSELEIMFNSEDSALQNDCFNSPNSVNKTLHFSPILSALELGILLESDGKSLQLSEPCLSPLSTGDSFNPFNDLILQSSFYEPTILDMCIL